MSAKETRAKRERDPVARWNAAVALATRDDRVAQLALAETLATPRAELEAELARDGVDVAAMNARAGAAFDAFMAKTSRAGSATAAAAKQTKEAERESSPESLQVGAWVAKVEPPASGPGAMGRGARAGRRSYAVVYAAAAAAATVGVATYLGTRPPPEQPEVKTPDAGPAPKVVPSADPVAEADALRVRAFAACERGAFVECLGGLDAARELDREGDAAPKVVAARKRAADGLGGKGGKGKADEKGKGDEKGGK